MYWIVLCFFWRTVVAVTAAAQTTTSAFLRWISPFIWMLSLFGHRRAQNFPEKVHFSENQSRYLIIVTDLWSFSLKKWPSGGVTVPRQVAPIIARVILASHIGFLSSWKVAQSYLFCSIQSRFHTTVFSNWLFKGFRLSSLFHFLCFQLLHLRYPAVSLLTMATVQLHINTYYEFHFKYWQHHIHSRVISLRAHRPCCCFVTDCIEIRNMWLCPVVTSPSSPSKHQNIRNPKDCGC